MDLNKMVMDSLLKLEKEGTIQNTIEKQIEKTMIHIIDDCYGMYSPFAKQVKKYISDNCNVDLSNLKIPEYNALIAVKVKETLEKFITESALKNMEDLLNEMLKDCKGKYTLSEIIESIIDDIDDKDELDYDETKGISLYIEKSSCDFVYIYLDKEEYKRKNDCKYRIGLYEGKVFNIRYDNNEITSKKVLSGLYGLEALMFKLYANKAEIILDQGDTPENYETLYSNPNYID